MFPIFNVTDAGLSGVIWPVKVRFTADGCAPRDFLLAQSTGQPRNPTSPLMDFIVPVTFVPERIDGHLRG